MNEGELYRIGRGLVELGEMTHAEIIEKWREGELRDDDLCWQAGMEDWQPLVEVFVFDAAPPPPPPPQSPPRLRLPPLSTAGPHPQVRLRLRQPTPPAAQPPAQLSFPPVPADRRLPPLPPRVLLARAEGSGLTARWGHFDEETSEDGWRVFGYTIGGLWRKSVLAGGGMLVGAALLWLAMGRAGPGPGPAPAQAGEGEMAAAPAAETAEAETAPEVMFKLALLTARQAKTRDELKLACKEIQQAAEGGHGRAALYATQLAQYGLLPREKEANNLVLLEGAAKQGDTDAMTLLGLREGASGPGSKGWKWLMKAREMGNARAQAEVAYLMCLTRNADCQKRGWEQLAALAKTGHAGALRRLGLLHAMSEAGNLDETKHRDLLRQAAELGDPEAAHKYGLLLYGTGQASPAMKTEALEWLVRGAQRGLGVRGVYLEVEEEHGLMLTPDQRAPLVIDSALYGNAAEQTNLGIYYLGGKGLFEVNQDPELAPFWLDHGVKANHAAAMRFLGALHLNGRHVPQDRARGLELMRQAAVRGDARAQGILARLLWENTTKDVLEPELAMELLVWCRLAKLNGSKDFEKDREFVQSHLSPAQIEECEKRVSRWEPVRDSIHYQPIDPDMEGLPAKVKKQIFQMEHLKWRLMEYSLDERRPPSWAF